ncbi:MAG: tRNA(m(1)G37)methyltransferase [Geoglossum umbratile]|nr:MAG: tRNA(m(1)G37)methyltransferase [Geoglossum umbratile]
MNSTSSVETTAMALFRPPINRAMRVLDKSFFTKEIPLSAARVFDDRFITKCRTDLARDMLKLERISSVRFDPEGGKKCLLLRPEVMVDDRATWSPTLKELVEAEKVGVIPYMLKLDYDYWTYHDIMTAILPEEDQDEIPVGFTQVGHIAHLNLRPPYEPYKHLLAQILLTKNPQLRTVINKTSTINPDSTFRTFSYELLAGDPDLNVEMKSSDCIFHFDYSKVYWNSRLNTEHRRLVELFKAGEAVCDVMAGVGPFAVPAGRKGVFVWANDLNPESFASLSDAVTRNKVTQFVHPHNEDARTFIPNSVNYLLKTATNPFTSSITLASKIKPSRSSLQPPQPTTTIPLPDTFSHYILNLPASSLTFLPCFAGLYAAHKHLFSQSQSSCQRPRSLPKIHIHTFAPKPSLDSSAASTEKSICTEIELLLRVEPGRIWGDVETVVWDVRDVAPGKRMFCVSFRLPEEVAFRIAEEEGEKEEDKGEGGKICAFGSTTRTGSSI